MYGQTEWISSHTSRSKASTREETRDDAVPGVLLLSVALDGAVKSREHATEHAEVAARNGSSCLDRCQSTNKAISLGVSNTINE
jgi:hypothetical protein